ncbi:hypothetical protein J6590_093823 [Homalodisca vitripennis]|nr:hypothetical protein J6590_093823 [Homalodisca vitripennis]
MAAFLNSRRPPQRIHPRHHTTLSHPPGLHPCSDASRNWTSCNGPQPGGPVHCTKLHYNDAGGVWGDRRFRHRL